jgi:hypothetical protein
VQKPKNNGKNRDWVEGEPNPTLAEPLDMDPFNTNEDLYVLAPLPPNPTGHQLRTALHHKAIDKICNSNYSVGEATASESNVRMDYDSREYPNALNHPDSIDTYWDAQAVTAESLEYSLSHPQGDINET